MSLSREEIIRMAKSFGLETEKEDGSKEEITAGNTVITMRVCNLVNAAYAAGAAAEREACAMVCDAIAEKNARSATEDEYEVLYPRMCAAAIRARGDK